MNILMISYGEYEYDGRLRELHKVSKQLGKTILFSNGTTRESDGHILVNASSYLKFIKKVVKEGKKLDSVDVIFLDNRKSILPGLLLKKHFKNAKIILDCRELYLSKYVKHFAGKVGCLIEKRGLKKADAIICANEERAVFMKDYYKLNVKPLVFMNLRALSFSSTENEIGSKTKFADINKPGEIRIVSTAGCDVSRLTDVLVTNLPKVSSPCRLFLIGSSTEKDKKTINDICAKNNIHNVEIIEKLNQDDLKALIDYCHIGVVSYHQNDLNNKYCASGKIYEFIYEGLPVVTTTNPPLQHFCEQFNVGCSSDSFYDSINQLVQNYGAFKKRVLSFCNNNSIVDNNNNLFKQLIAMLTK